MPGMGDLKDQTENVFLVHRIGFKYLGVTGTVYRLPTGLASMVCLKALADNAGHIYWQHKKPQMTAPAAADDADAGWELQAGDQTLWFMVGNLNEIYLLTLNAGDGVNYWAMD